VECVDSRGLVSVLFDDGDLDYDVDLACIFAMPAAAMPAAAPSSDLTLGPKPEGEARGSLHGQGRASARDAGSDVGAPGAVASGWVKELAIQDGKGRQERGRQGPEQCRLGHGAPKKGAGVRASGGKRAPGVSKLGAVIDKYKCPTCSRDFSKFHPNARAGCAARHRRACALSFAGGSGHAGGEAVTACHRTCHHCSKVVQAVRSCGRCPRVFCERCLGLHVREGIAALESEAGMWTCPVCSGTCCCCNPSSAQPCSQSHRHCATVLQRARKRQQRSRKRQSALETRRPLFKTRLKGRPLTTDGVRRKKKQVSAFCRLCLLSAASLCASVT